MNQTLFSLYLSIDRYLYSFKSIWLSDKNKTFLLQIQNEINAIKLAQYHWDRKKSSSHRELTLIRASTQKMAKMKRAKINNRKTLGLSWLTMNKLLNEIDHEIKTARHTYFYHKFLRKIKKRIIQTRDHIRPKYLMSS